MHASSDPLHTASLRNPMQFHHPNLTHLLPSYFIFISNLALKVVTYISTPHHRHLQTNPNSGVVSHSSNLTLPLYIVPNDPIDIDLTVLHAYILSEPQMKVVPCCINN